METLTVMISIFSDYIPTKKSKVWWVEIALGQNLIIYPWSLVRETRYLLCHHSNTKYYTCNTSVNRSVHVFQSNCLIQNSNKYQWKLRFSIVRFVDLNIIIIIHDSCCNFSMIKIKSNKGRLRLDDNDV